MLSSPSSIVLIVANLLPIGGVLFFGWSVLELLLLYWAESVVIGIINVLRMLYSQAGNPLAGYQGQVPATATDAMDVRRSSGGGRGLKFFLIPFFTLHYGAFCYAHLAAVTGIFSSGSIGALETDATGAFADPVFWLIVGSIFASHFYSFLSNFIGGGEFRRTGVGSLMQRPYGRIMVMHITVIGGAAMISWLDNPLPMLLVLVIGKIIVDLRMHQRERKQFSEAR